MLQRAVQACPQSVTLWLMNAKEHWLAGDVPAARAALEAAHDSIPESEEIVLAAFKLEFENGEPDRARVIAIRAKDSLPDASARVWMKAAVASRELGNEQVMCFSRFQAARILLGRTMLMEVLACRVVMATRQASTVPWAVLLCADSDGHSDVRGR